MNKIKAILFTLLMFLAGVVISFFTEGNYRQLIQDFFKLFKGDKITFFGKGFYFGNYTFVTAAGIYFAFIFLVLYKQSFRTIASRLLLAVVSFFVAAAITSFIDSTIKLANHDPLESEVLALNFNAIDYNLHLMIDLGLSLLTVGIAWIRTRRSEKSTN